MFDLLLQPDCILIPGTMHGDISLRIRSSRFQYCHSFSSNNGNRFTSKVMGYMELTQTQFRSNLIKCENPFGLIEDIDSNCLRSPRYKFLL